MKRHCILDDVRGVAVISMILYHLVWDLVNLAGLDLEWFNGAAGLIWQRSICFTFIMLSGFCWRLGGGKPRRGLTVFAAGAAVTLATVTVMPENRVVFGILTLLGSCILLMIPLDRLLRRRSAALGFALSLALYAVTRNVRKGELAFGLIRLPSCLYRNMITAFAGFPPEGFFSADYYPLIPWMFLFTAGYCLYGLCVERDGLKLLERKGLPPLEWVGRHSLIIYLLHQPVLAMILYLGGLIK